MYHSLFFDKVAVLRLASLLRKRFWRRCFPVNFEKCLRTPFLQNTTARLLFYGSSKYSVIWFIIKLLITIKTLLLKEQSVLGKHVHYQCYLILVSGLCKMQNDTWYCQHGKKWSVFSVSRALKTSRHSKFTVTAKLCRNLCSRKWLKPDLSLLRTLDLCGLQMLSSEGLIKVSSYLWNIITWKSRVLTSGLNLFISLLLKHKQEFQNKSLL